MDWKDAPIARVATIPGALELTLEEVALLGGLWKLTHANPSKIFCWPYFEKAFGLSVSKARTRLARLERAGLISRSLVGTRGSDATGSRIYLTQMGKDLIRTVAPILSNDRKPACASSVSPPPATPKVPDRPERRQDVRFTDFPESFQKGVLALGVEPLRLVKRVIEEGRALSEDDVADVGLPRSAARLLNEALDRDWPRWSTSARADVATLGHGPCNVSLGSLKGAATESDVAEAVAAGVDVPRVLDERAGGLAGMAKLIVAEAATRYRKVLSGHEKHRVVTRLQELLWSCTQGPLSEFGEPLKRVRVGLRLMADGRWESPIGYVPEARPAFAMAC